MTDLRTTARKDDLGDDLPPVQPPSAGFIVQLFVVPALIVLAVVGVWALFGRMAAGDQDWQRLVQDLGSANPHVHERAMYGLATLLDRDQRLQGRGQHLSANSQIAAALAEQFDKSLGVSSQTDETLSTQVYLARALGLLDVPDATVPVLSKALEAQRDVDVRKGAVLSLALIAGRALDRGQPLGADAIEALIELSTDHDPALRRPAAFALGLTPAPTADDRLRVLLEDGDQMTAVNAAVALARQKSTAGFAVFEKALLVKVDAADREAQQEAVLIQKNVLRAVAELGARFDAAQRSRLQQVIQPLADRHPEPRIRIDAQGALIALTKEPRTK
jgi:hypothetical protein